MHTGVNTLEDLFNSEISNIGRLLPCNVARVYPATVLTVPSYVVYLECWWSGLVVFLKIYRKISHTGELMAERPVVGVAHYALDDGHELFYPAIDVDAKYPPSCRGEILRVRYFSARHRRYAWHIVLKPATHPLEAIRKMSLCGTDKRHLEYAIKRSITGFFPYDFAVLRVSSLRGEDYVVEYADESDPMVALHLYLRERLRGYG